MCIVYLNDSENKKAIESKKYSFTKIDNQIYFGYGTLIQYKHLSILFNGALYLSHSYKQGELILHLYEQFGLDSLLDGEYAFI